MNATEFVDDSNETFSGNLSVQPTRSYHNSSDEAWSDFTVTDALVIIIIYGAYALGIPGDILSAIVWLRLHLANENQSAIYLAALAINDLVFLLFDGSALVTGSAGVRVSVLFDFGARRCGHSPHLGHAAAERVTYMQVPVSATRTSR